MLRAARNSAAAATRAQPSTGRSPSPPPPRPSPSSAKRASLGPPTAASARCQPPRAFKHVARQLARALGAALVAPAAHTTALTGAHARWWKSGNVHEKWQCEERCQAMQGRGRRRIPCGPLLQRCAAPRALPPSALPPLSQKLLYTRSTGRRHAVYSRSCCRKSWEGGSSGWGTRCMSAGSSSPR